MIWLWLVIGLITLAVVAAMLWPLLSDRTDRRTRAEHDLEVYRDQLKEIEGDRARGVLSEAEATAARLEVQRRLLRADADRLAGRAAADAGRDWRMIAAGLIAVAVPLGAMALYAKLGQPNLPAQPFAARQDAGPAVAGADSRAGQIGDLVSRLESRLKTQPNDVQGWALLGRSYLMLERPADAAEAYRKATELAPADADLRMGLAESQVFAAQGVISPRALEDFRRTLALEPDHPGARYYLALHKNQTGDLRGAYDDWIALYRDTPADAPWKSALEARLGEVARSLKIDLAQVLPALTPRPAPAPPTQPATAADSAAPRGPSADDIAAAQQMSDGDRNEMIRGMVQRLADRLRENPADYDGWMRLGRAYGVLREADKARDAFENALKQRPGDQAARQALAQISPMPGAQPVTPAQTPAVPAAEAPRVAGGAPPGPTADDVRAAQSMSEADRQQMVRGMVQRLAERMKETPDDGAGWARLGQAYAVMQQWKEAEEAYGKAAALTPDDAQVLVAHGATIVQLEGQERGLPPRAEGQFRQALALDPENLDALWYVGVAEMQAGRPRVALAHWQRLLAKLDPSSEEYRDVTQAIDAARKRLGSG